jgi:NifU-like protein
MVPPLDAILARAFGGRTPMAWDYSEKLKDHFFHPRNVGAMDDAHGKGEVGSIACGDALTFYIKTDPKTDRITEATFKTFGCGSAIASASALTEMVIGKTIQEALKITNQDIADYLGGIPQEKMHCSVMGREALEAAVADMRGEQRAPDQHEDGAIVCHCFGVTDKKIERAIRENNLRTVEQVTNYTKAGGGCGTCQAEIEAILNKILEEERRKPAPRPAAVGRMTQLKKIALVQETIEHEIRPVLQKDGGDIELIDIEGDTVRVALVAHCAGCRSAQFTTGWIQDKMRELVANTINVVVEPPGTAEAAS